MANPDDGHSNNFYDPNNDPYLGQLDDTPLWFQSEWIYNDVAPTSTEPMPSFLNPQLDISDKSYDMFASQANDPFPNVMPLPTTVSGADLNLNLAPPSIPNRMINSQPSTNTSTTDDSLLLGGPSESDTCTFDLQQGHFTSPGDLGFIPNKPTYKPGWATASGSGSRTPAGNYMSSTPSTRRRAPRTRSSMAAPSPDTKDDLGSDDDDGGEEATAASKSKRSHNLTEKKYRTRLNGFFESLLAAIPRKPITGPGSGEPDHAPEKKISKGEVLVLAIDYIRELETNHAKIEDHRDSLMSDLKHFKEGAPKPHKDAE